MKKKVPVIFLIAIFIIISLIFTQENSITPLFQDFKEMIASLSGTKEVSDTTDATEVLSDVDPVVSQKPVLNNTAEYKSYIDDIINANLNSSMSDYEKVKWVHDYIIINTSYDTTSTDIPDSSFSPDGVLTKGVAVCQGYAETFQLFMDCLKIKCRLITGTANDISHAWNVVKIDGQWYNIDVTWDDPVVNNQVVGGTDNLVYSYFLKPDSIFNIDHAADNKTVECTSEKYLYIEQYYNVPYVVLNTVNEIPDTFIEHYKNGTTSLTMYFPEDTDPEQSGLLTELYKKIYYYANKNIDFQYYPVTRYANYSYITVFIK